jgi:hypothetical protein
MPPACFNRDVPQEVIRRILDHDSPQMTAHYAKARELHQTGEKAQVTRSLWPESAILDRSVAAA